METTIHELKRWIRRHYGTASSAPVMEQILTTYADPVVEAFGTILTLLKSSASEWMAHDVRDLFRSLRLPWAIVDPPPRSLSAEQMVERLRAAARQTRDIFKEQVAQWLDEFADDADPFVVTDTDLAALRQTADMLAPLAALKSPQSVRRQMDKVIAAAMERRERAERRRQQATARRLLNVKAEAAMREAEHHAAAAAARDEGLGLGAHKRSRDHVPHGMLHTK
jgi:hypothetical protein